MVLDFAHNFNPLIRSNKFSMNIGSRFIAPPSLISSSLSRILYNHIGKRSMWNVAQAARHISTQATARGVLFPTTMNKSSSILNSTPSSRGFAFNRAHVKKNAIAKINSDKSLTQEKKEELSDDLNRLSSHNHPLYVDLDSDGKTCTAGGTLTKNPPFDGRPVSPHHQESQGVQVQNHPTHGPQFALAFKEDFVVNIEIKYLNIGPEIAADGSAANAELSEHIESLKEKLKN